MYIELILGLNTLILSLIGCYIYFSRNWYKKQLDDSLLTKNSEINNQHKLEITQLREFLIQHLFKEHLDNSERLQNSFKLQLESFISEFRNNLIIQHNNTNKQMENLNTTLFQQLSDIRKNLDNSLTNNLTKSNETYSDIAKRLALIDAAQKRIGELSSNIVSLQDILSDKQARGAFGEIQLATIVKNILPAGHYKLQHTLSNGKRADCIVELPEPTGKLIIDSKFPLESYRLLQQSNLTNEQRENASKQFKRDIQKHITDIASKYILPNETADCAIMFIPAESVFSEIHSNHPDLVNVSFQEKVWMVSPTTMMAILNTSSAVIKDLARQKEINLIQNHLNMLAKDFQRFQQRMNALSRHIRLANEDVDNVNASAKKIVSRFDQIEKVEIEPSLPAKKLMAGIED